MTYCLSYLLFFLIVFHFGKYFCFAVVLVLAAGHVWLFSSAAADYESLWNEQILHSEDQLEPVQ